MPTHDPAVTGNSVPWSFLLTVMSTCIQIILYQVKHLTFSSSWNNNVRVCLASWFLSRNESVSAIIKWKHPISTELGTVSRNCTMFGWSETFPHYIDACLYEETGSNHTVSWSPCLQPSELQGFWVRRLICSVFAVPLISGHILCIGEGSIHSGLQHLFGLPHHGHGHPVQVQVRCYEKQYNSAGL